MSGAVQSGEPSPPNLGLSPFARRLGVPVQRFIATEVGSGAILMAAVLLALVWANSPWSASYFGILATPLSVAVGSLSLTKPLVLWVNDGLMAIFFYLVGLEIKREVLHGELSSPRAALLPIAAAVGGMVTPAAIYLAINGFGETAGGWAIPMATDIALALGVLALLGRRVPTELRVFLLALAIVDDLGAIAVIALFFTESVSVEALLIGAVLLGLIVFGLRFGVRSRVVYLVLAVLFWVALLKSGIHATVAGVLLAMVTPAKPGALPVDSADSVPAPLEDSTTGLPLSATPVTSFEDPPLERLERQLHPWVSYLIVPLFAWANAGVVLSGEALTIAATSGVSLGVAAGLVLGKPLGVLGVTLIMVRSGLAVLPHRVRWPQLAGVGMLAGIGFTVALFIDELAFTSRFEEDLGKVGILVASVVAGALGYGLLRMTTSASPPPLVDPLAPATPLR